MKSIDPKYRQVERQLKEDILSLQPGGKMATVRELKKKFGVSQSTLDHALQKLESKKLIVRRKSSGIYVDGGSRQKRHSIGVILQNVSDRYYAHLLQGMEKELSERNYKIILANTPKELEKEIEFIDSLTDSVDGMIITPRTGNSIDQDYVRFLVELKERRKIPCVFIEIPVPCVDSRFVSFNQRKAFYDVTYQIVTNGETGDLVFVGLQESVVSVERFAGFKAALLAVGAGGRKVNIVTADIGLDVLDFSFVEREVGKPPVVFVASPILLPKVLGHLQSKGCRLPQDAIVVSVVEEDYQDYISQPIIAIVKPAVSLGSLAARSMLDAIAGKEDMFSGRVDLLVEMAESVREMLKL